MAYPKEDFLNSINGSYGNRLSIITEQNGSRRVTCIDLSNRVYLSWNKINVFVKPESRRCFGFGKRDEVGEQKQLLHSISGSAQPGHVLAIMGASGAGKTTLLNVLTNRNLRRLNVEGDVLVNGQNVGKSITKFSAYVQQDDLFIGTLKVREHLVFQALLRMKKAMSYEDRMKKVEKVILQLGLSKCADTRIGFAGRDKGISGGEAKRLAFAAEVLTNPPLMFCDEPTSGLDSFMAQSVVSVLRDLAKLGRTIVCTIHQPSSETFEMFDHLLLLADGRVAFRGEASDALDFFARAGLRCPINYNPADFYIHNLSITPGNEKETKDRVAVICDQFAQEHEKDQQLSPETQFIFDTETKPNNGYKTSWFSQFKVVFWRSWISMIREPMTTKVRLMQSIVIAVVLGLVFFQQKVDERGVMNINGALFIILMNTTFSNLMTVINAFTLEMPIFLRERKNGMYRTDVYFLCKTLAEAPILAGASICLACIIYFMIGFNPDYKAFFIFVIILILITNVASSFGYMVSCITGSVNVALSISLPMIMPMVLFGGFYLNNASVPVYFLWLKYISWFYYGNEALVINQWRDIKNITCSTNRCPRNGTEVLSSFSFEEENLNRDIGMCFVLFVLFRIFAFLALLRKSSKKT